MTTLQLIGVGVRAQGRPLLDDVHLTVSAGSVMGIVGPSGSGKTTLLRVLAGLTLPTTGTALFDGNARAAPGLVSMALQDDPVYEHFDVSDNLGFPIDMAGQHAEDRDRRIEGTARRMGIHKVLRRRSGQLSGGERAAVSVGRAMTAPRARFLLLDEPLATADRRRREAFRRLLRSLAADRPDLGIVIASNDQADLMGLADLLVVMDSGSVAQIGPPSELYDRPADLRVAGFLGSPPMNLFPSTVETAAGGATANIGTDTVALDMAADDERAAASMPGRPLVFGVRPEHLHVAGPEVPFNRVLHATAGWVEDPTGLVWFGLGRVGAMAHAFVKRPGEHVVAGDRLELTWAPDKTRIFDARSGRAIPKSIIGSAD
jgi:multiple sugar transport system ATP-binding protein